MSAIPRLSVGSACLILLLTTSVSAQPRRWPLGNTSEMKAAAIKEKFNTMITVKALQQERPLPEFLKVLEEQIPKDLRIAFAIDEKAFGKNFEALARTRLQFEKYPQRISVATALRLILQHLRAEFDADYRILPTHVAITTRQQARFLKTYEVADLMKEAKRLGRALSPIPQESRNTTAPARTESDTERILRIICMGFGNLHFEPVIDGVQLLNERKMIVRGNQETHDAVIARLDGLRRFLDLAVVMQARLIEVERGFYLKEVAPLLKAAKNRDGWKLPVTIPKDLLGTLQKKPSLIEGDFFKIIPHEPTTFLAAEHLSLPGCSQIGSDRP